jgi:purine-binding chemotaxis protein CheW
MEQHEGETHGSDVDFAALRRLLDEAGQSLEGTSAATVEMREATLAARTQALATPREEAQTDALTVLAFRLAGERYAIKIREVDEILELKMIYPLPDVPGHVLGVVAARSAIIPVLDLRVLLQLERGGLSDLSAVVVVSSGDQWVGLAVDAVDGTLDLPMSGSQSSSSLPGPFELVTADRVAVLTLARLLAVEPEEPTAR